MSESLHCSKCGATLPATGICAACAADFLAGEPTAGPGEPFVPPTVAELAEKFPQLEVIELVGKGGMGAVYQARQRELDRIVALKILPPGIGEDPAFAERFAREARALAKLSHPNIVTLFEYGRAEGGPYFFLMEFVDGVNLRQLLLAERMSPREALEIVPQICDALQFAHDHGIVHRDIKPENILLDRRGRVKVADFGLAKLIGSAAEETGGESATDLELTGTGKVLGTPSYMAPEQTLRPDSVDHRADIYALGVVFYQMLTGELPGASLEPPSRKVRIDVRLDEVVLRALEKNPERRYQQVSLLKAQVKTMASDANFIAPPSAAAPSRRSPARMIALGCGVLILLAGGLTIGLVSLFWLRASILNNETQRAVQSHIQAARQRMEEDLARAKAREISASRLGSSEALPAFGPVIERDLPFLGATTGIQYLSFESGQIFSPPASMPADDDASARQWLIQNHVDANAEELATGPRLVSYGYQCGYKTVESNRWLSIRPEEVVAELQTGTMQAVAECPNPQALPATFLFKTRDGAMGLVQMLRVLDGPRRVKIRFKLVRTKDASTPAHDSDLAQIQAWLLLMDGGQYAPAWQDAAASFHEAVTRDDWVAKSREIREPLGKVVSRNMSSSQRLSTLPGMPDGSYFVAEYQTSFEKLPAATETVGFSRDAEGRWRAISYLIRPGDESSAASPPKTEAERAAVAAAETWLAGIDAGKYAESWPVSAAAFRAAISQAKWVLALESVRAPLGALQSRKLHSALTTPNLPGAPEGPYVVMKFDTSFENKQSAVETVTFQLEPDQQWRASGYYLK